MLPSTFEKILKYHEDTVESFGYATFDLTRIAQSNYGSITASDKARIEEINVGVYGVTPNIFSATIETFLSVSSEPYNSGLEFGE